MSSTRVTKFVRGTTRSPGIHTNNIIALPLSAPQAKEKVLAHWDYLDHLCQQRFPYSSNMAHEGLLFIMEKLEQDNWQRVRTWRGQGRFSTYITTLSSRLLTDFQRKKQGHIRLPVWIKEKLDPIWLNAYQLLILETLPRREAVNKLHTLYPDKECRVIEEVVMSLLARCDLRLRPMDQCMNPGAVPDAGSTHFSPETELAFNSEDLSAALWQLLQGDPPSSASPSTQRVQELLARLRPHLKLGESDALLLRLKFVDGLSIKKIAQLMNLDGDPYKRLNRILKKLRQSFSDAEMDGIE